MKSANKSRNTHDTDITTTVDYARSAALTLSVAKLRRTRRLPSSALLQCLQKLGPQETEHINPFVHYALNFTRTPPTRSVALKLRNIPAYC